MQNVSRLFQQMNIFSNLDKFEIQDDIRYVAKGPDMHFETLNVEDIIKLYLTASSYNLN